MKILLCYATAGEGKIIKQQIKNLNLKIHLDITYLCTGMGMYETIFNLTKVLNSQTFDIVLNIGVCGYIGKKKDRIQVARTVNLTTNKELIVPIFVELKTSHRLAGLESIGCSEVVIGMMNTEGGMQNGKEKKIINSKFGILNYIDMESWAIEYVCDKFKVPRVIVKVPVDKIGEEVFDRGEGEKMLKENLDYGMIIRKLIS